MFTPEMTSDLFNIISLIAVICIAIFPLLCMIALAKKIKTTARRITGRSKPILMK